MIATGGWRSGAEPSSAAVVTQALFSAFFVFFLAAAGVEEAGHVVAFLFLPELLDAHGLRPFRRLVAYVVLCFITSPTFTLVHSYDTAGKITLHHADIYRLSTQHEVADLALAELVEYDGIVLLEWGDVVAQSLGDHLLVRLDTNLDDEHAREITISGTGRPWAQRWDRLTTALEGFRC